MTDDFETSDEALFGDLGGSEPPPPSFDQQMSEKPIDLTSIFGEEPTMTKGGHGTPVQRPDVLGDAIKAGKTAMDLSRLGTAAELDAWREQHLADATFEATTQAEIIKLGQAERLWHAAKIARAMETTEAEKRALAAPDDPDEGKSETSLAIEDLSLDELNQITRAAKSKSLIGLPRELRPLAKSLITGTGTWL